MRLNPIPASKDEGTKVRRYAQIEDDVATHSFPRSIFENCGVDVSQAVVVVYVLLLNFSPAELAYVIVKIMLVNVIYCTCLEPHQKAVRH